MFDAHAPLLPFASQAYVERLMLEINANDRYEHLAQKWEGPVYLEVKDRKV